MSQTPTEEAIAILIDLAQAGEIDPWDVDVIKVIDRFLEQLGLSDSGEIELSEEAAVGEVSRADLPQSGQAFLWASMLVLLKADSLESLQTQDEEFLAEEENLDGLDASFRLPLHLEHHIRRRAAAPPLKRRKVTLEELIDQIRHIAVEIDSLTPRHLPVRQQRQYTRKEALQTITELAHNENLTELAERLAEFLVLSREQLSDTEESIDFEDLLEAWAKYNSHPEIRELSSETADGKDRVGVFWALLLLTSQAKVELSQQDFYQDLKINLAISEIDQQ
jgi:segregation and condensation protein A